MGGCHQQTIHDMSHNRMCVLMILAFEKSFDIVEQKFNLNIFELTEFGP